MPPPCRGPSSYHILCARPTCDGVGPVAFSVLLGGDDQDGVLDDQPLLQTLGQRLTERQLLIPAGRPATSAPSPAYNSPTAPLLIPAAREAGHVSPLPGIQQSHGAGCARAGTKETHLPTSHIRDE